LTQICAKEFTTLIGFISVIHKFAILFGEHNNRHWLGSFLSIHNFANFLGEIQQ
jgi:hypothetical protein